MKIDLLKILSSTSLFKGLDDDALGRISEIGAVQDVARGDIVIREGEINQRLLLIIQGEFDVVLPETVDRFSAINLAQRGVGDALGEYSFADGLPAIADVHAIDKATVFVLEHDALHTLLDSDPELGTKVYKNLLLELVRRLRMETSELDLFRP